MGEGSPPSTIIIDSDEADEPTTPETTEYDKSSKVEDVSEIFAWRSYWVGLAIPNVLLFISLLWADEGGVSNLGIPEWTNFGFVVLWSSLVSLVALFLYGCFTRNKAMLLGILCAVLIAPFVYYASCEVGIPRVFEST